VSCSSSAAPLDTDIDHRHNDINQNGFHNAYPQSTRSPFTFYHSMMLHSDIHNPPPLLPQLPKTNLLIIMFIQHLRRRQIEVLLRHVHPPLPQRKHPGFGTYAFQLGARAAVHLLGDLEQVDPAGEVHAAGVDAQDVGAGFDAVGAGEGVRFVWFGLIWGEGGRGCGEVKWGRGTHVGGGNSILRSILPGLNSAGSKISSRLVAMMTLMFLVGSKPSSWFSSSSIVRCTSLSPPLLPSTREEPMLSISSMKMMLGACSRAITKSSRTIREPSPMYFWTSSEPDTRMNLQSAWWATARARSVFPVPGGP